MGSCLWPATVVGAGSAPCTGLWEVTWGSQVCWGHSSPGAADRLSPSGAPPGGSSGAQISLAVLTTRTQGLAQRVTLNVARKRF